MKALIVLFGILLFAGLVYGFSEPTANPPAGNVGPPVPSGAILFFDLASCPSGWTHYSAGNGRYVVMSPSSIAAQVGSALSNQENRTVGYHTHSVHDPGHGHSVGITWVPLTHPTHSWFYDIVAFNGGFSGGAWGGSLTANNSGTGISIYPAGSVGGTNAPYIQLLGCRKK